MKKNGYFLTGTVLALLGLILLFLANSGLFTFDPAYIETLPAALPAADSRVAIVNVSLISMDSDRVLENRTVIVRGQSIERIGPAAEVQVPDGAEVVDGTGQFLMPGLVDMHVHIESENDLLLFITNGVTAVRNMWGNTDKKLSLGLADQLELRQKIASGERLGPTIYTAGPIMEGSPAFHPAAEVFDTPRSAQESVRWQAEQGYDFIKVYDHLAPEVYHAIAVTAQDLDLSLAGHVPFEVGLDGVLASGQRTIEHLTGYLDPDEARLLIPPDALDEYAKKTRQAGVWNCVTLTEYPKSMQTEEGIERLKSQVGMRYVSPGMRLLAPFLYAMTARSHTYPGEDYAQRMIDLNQEVVQALHRAGAPILLGTDAAQAYHVPGFSVHEELAMLVEAGLSPYEALAAGTIHAAQALERSDEFGTIEAGKRADLLLLEANPLEDVSNADRRSGVILRGRWMPQNELQSILDGLENSYQPDFLERIWPLVLLLAAGWCLRRGVRL